MDAANGTDESATEDDSSLYAAGLELLGQFQAILGKMKARQEQKLMQHFVPGSGSSNYGCVGAPSAGGGVCSNNASSGSRVIHRDQQKQQPFLVTEPSELKLRIKLDLWVSETGELTVHPSLLAENAENGAGYAGQPLEHGDGGHQLDSRNDSGGSGASSCSGSGGAAGASAGAGADAGSHHGNGSDNSSNKSSISNGADCESAGQQRQTAVNRAAAVASISSLQQQNSGDLPQLASVGVTKAGPSNPYKHLLGVIQGQLKQQQKLQNQQLLEKQQQMQRQQHRVRIASSGGRSSTDKAEREVTTAKKESNAVLFASDSTLQRSCHRCSYHDKAA